MATYKFFANNKDLAIIAVATGCLDFRLNPNGLNYIIIKTELTRNKIEDAIKVFLGKKDGKDIFVEYNV